MDAQCETGMNKTTSAISKIIHAEAGLPQLFFPNYKQNLPELSVSFEAQMYIVST